MADLRGYQSDLVGDISGKMKGGARCVAAISPTGSGKSVMISHTTGRFVAQQKPVLIMAHRTRLVWQLAKQVRNDGLDYGLVMPGVTPLSSLVKIGMVQTISRRLDDPAMREFSLIHADEGHHAVTKGYRDIFDANPQARIILWTASPERLDGRGLGRDAGGPCDAMAEGPTVASLMDGGYLVRAVLIGPKLPPDLSHVKMDGADYNAESLASVLDLPDVTGDAVAQYRQHCPGLATIVFCCDVRHCENVAESFRKDGWAATALHGGMSQAKQDAALRALEDGSLQIITSCDLIGEGVDIPHVACIIKLRKTASLALNVQWDGRPLRTLPGMGGNLAAIAASSKPRAYILDHCANYLVHGGPAEPRNWTLTGTNKKDRPIPEYVQCPTCQVTAKPSFKCAKCGHSFVAAKADMIVLKPKDVAAGELVIIDQDRLSLMRATPLKDLLKSARTIEALEEIETAKDYKPGWAAKQKAFREAAYLKHRYGDRAT